MVADKAVAALNAGLTPVVCIGETLAEQDAGQTADVIERQLAPVLALGAHAVHIPYPLLWEHEHVDHDEDPALTTVVTTEGPVPLAPYLAENDIVVNCTLQDPSAPLTYLQTADVASFRQGSLIVDVSCDEGMGFSWAVPTTFDEPMFTVGDRVHYYAVDHSPSYLWNSATWENSEALLPFVPVVMAGGSAWDADTTVSKAIEVRDGVIQNPAILTFQGRAADYPHRPQAAA